MDFGIGYDGSANPSSQRRDNQRIQHHKYCGKCILFGGGLCEK